MWRALQSNYTFSVIIYTAVHELCFIFICEASVLFMSPCVFHLNCLVLFIPVLTSLVQVFKKLLSLTLPVTLTHLQLSCQIHDCSIGLS